MRGALRYAIVLALLVGLLLPTALLLLYDAQVSRRVALDDLRGDLTRTAKVMALSLAEPIWQVSPDLAEPMILAQVEDLRFVSVRVVEPSTSKPFLSFQRQQADETAQAEADLTLTLSETVPVMRDGREIARLTVSMTAAPLVKAKQAEMLRTLLRSLGTLTLSSMLILWVMQRRVLHPMARLTRAAEALAAGQLDQPLALGGTDEIARVGHAMERMRQALLSAFDALRQHANTLEEQVTQRTAELAKAQNELVESEKLASLGRLVAGVAHELNTPLGNALTVVSALGDRYKELDQLLNDGTPVRRSALEALVRDTRRGQDILQRNVHRAAELVSNFKQIAIDQTTDQRRSFDLASEVRGVVMMVDPTFKLTPFLIRTELVDGLTMNGYPGPLGQVLTNLLMNALVHGFDGRTQGRVTVQCAPLNADTCTLTVSDDGVGMDDAVRRRVFEPFFTTKLGTGGSGLGMHIVHNIITRMLGGQIEVISKPGAGTQMKMLLPRIAPTRAFRDGDGDGDGDGEAAAATPR